MPISMAIPAQERAIAVCSVSKSPMRHMVAMPAFGEVKFAVCITISTVSILPLSPAGMVKGISDFSTLGFAS